MTGFMRGRNTRIGGEPNSNKSSFFGGSVVKHSNEVTEEEDIDEVEVQIIQDSDSDDHFDRM